VPEYLIEADCLLYELINQADGGTRQQKKQIGETDLAARLEVVGDMTLHAFSDVGIFQEPQEDLSADSVTAENDQPKPAPPPEGVELKAGCPL
jgi:hypothetical protein